MKQAISGNVWFGTTPNHVVGKVDVTCVSILVLFILCNSFSWGALQLLLASVWRLEGS